MKKSADQQVPLIMDFLRDVANNNNRPWFQANRQRYEEVKDAFEAITAQLITRISEFDESVRMLQVKDCTYRFYRDTRFSQDKSPYKRHFGAYIAARGKKFFHGGYYLHLQPGNCMFAVGCYCLPTNILKVIRQLIVDDVESFNAIVLNPEFKATFPRLTMTPLKVMPAGLPRDFEHPEYLKCKDYLVWTEPSDKYFELSGWMDDIIHQAQLAKPFLDYLNDVVDDYI